MRTDPSIKTPRRWFRLPVRGIRRSVDRGFMLVELVVVTTILGTIAGIAIPLYAANEENAYDTAAAAELRTWVTLMEGARFTYGDTFGPVIPTPPGTNDDPSSHEKSAQIVGSTPGLDDFGHYSGYVFDDRTNHVFCFSSDRGIIHLIDSGADLAANQAACVL